jgi:PAS domain-containing protein
LAQKAPATVHHPRSPAVYIRRDGFLGEAPAISILSAFVRDGAVADVGGALHDATDAHDLRRALERQKRTFDLAMTASQMGTWRYTFADNICVYDKNAQRIYGLTEARFLHGEAGARSKIHPDDLELMWSRVAKALDLGATAGTRSSTGSSSSTAAGGG